MSARKYGSIPALKEAVLLLTDKGNVDQALRIIHDFVERIITEPLCTSQVYGSKTLDDLCQRIGKANLAEIRRDIADATFSQQVKQSDISASVVCTEVLSTCIECAPQLDLSNLMNK